jgi:hypothetical protein
MWFLFFLTMVFAVEVDLAPSGAVVTVRPEAGEIAAIVLADTGEIVPLLVRTPPTMWLVHPAAWRNAVAMATGEEIRDPLVDEQAKIILNLETDLTKEKGLRSEIRLSLEECKAARETEAKMLRRSRTQWTLAALGTGLALGAAGTVAVVVAL